MLKVLIIGNILENSGWSNQMANTVLALDTQPDSKVIPRNITILGNNNPDINPRILELIKQDCKKPDVIIYNTLPSLYEYHYGSKNIGLFVSESSDIRASGWPIRANLMDEIINCCYWNKEVSKKSGITKPIHILNQAIDINKSKSHFPEHAIRQHFKNEFLFYTIGEWTTRKNMECLIRAFHLEFKPTENVQLIIKTTPNGLGNNPMQTLQNKVNDIKMGLKLYRNIESYKKEVLMVGQASEEEIYSIHQAGDCFVSTSHAESFCIPAAVAMSMGKRVIVPNYGGFLEYCTNKNSFLIEGKEDYIHSAQDTLPDLYTGREKWFYPSVESLRTQMRLAYAAPDKRVENQGLKDIQKLSFENIGKLYKEALEK